MAEDSTSSTPWTSQYAHWMKSYDTPGQCIKKQKHHFAEKGPYSQNYGFYPVVTYRCESWTIKKAECQRIDVFELWCWRRLLRVPWTIGRSNQSILKEINLNIHLKDRCWSWSANTLAIWCKELTHYKDSRKDWGQEKGATEVEMVDGITDLMDLSLSKLR